MANLLKMALVESIVTLRQRGWSVRRIARELGIHRETVARHLRLVERPAKPAMAPTGSAALPAESKPAMAPTGSVAATGRVGRPSDCEPYRPIIVGALDQGLTAQRIYQDRVNGHGFRGSYYSVRRFVVRLDRTTAFPMRRLECGPGEEVQVDFGTAAPVVLADGRRRRPHVFRIVRSHSRKAYSEVVPRPTTEAFLRCRENAFWHVGGVPRRVVLDNLRAAVTRADWFDPDLNPKVRALAQHYGTVFLPTKPRTPRHKGKIERGIGDVKGNALRGRTFASMGEQNQFLTEWERTVADTRVHGTTRQQLGKVFTEVERPALLPLPAARFPCFDEGQRTVSRDGHVEVERAFYSVPPEYLGRKVWARWDGRTVRILNQRFESIALPVRHEPGRFRTQAGHVVHETISGIEHGAAGLLERVRRLGPHGSRWAEALLQARGVEGVRGLQGLLSLAKRYRAEQLEHACDIAHSYGAFRLRTLRQLIDRAAPKQQQFALLEEGPLIRPLSEYAQFVHDAIQKGATS